MKLVFSNVISIYSNFPKIVFVIFFFFPQFQTGILEGITRIWLLALQSSLISLICHDFYGALLIYVIIYP